MAERGAGGRALPWPGFPPVFSDGALGQAAGFLATACLIPMAAAGTDGQAALTDGPEVFTPWWGSPLPSGLRLL